MKVNRELMQRFRKPKERVRLAEVRQDFRDANLSTRNAHNYIKDNLRKEKFDIPIKEISKFSFLGVPLFALLTQLKSSNSLFNFCSIIPAVGAAGATLLYITVNGYDLFSPYRHDFYDNPRYGEPDQEEGVKQIAMQNRALAKKTILGVDRLYSMSTGEPCSSPLREISEEDFDLRQHLITDIGGLENVAQ